jgi:hypothetical protein
MAPINNTGVANREVAAEQPDPHLRPAGAGTLSWRHSTSSPSTNEDNRFGLHWPLLAALLGLMALCGCASKSARPVTESSALVITPVSRTSIRDRRPEFRNIFCAVLEARNVEQSREESCDERLLRLSDELPGRQTPVELGVSQQAFTVIFIAGLYSDCVDQTNQARTQFKDYLARFGYHFETLRVSGVSSTESNARFIRDALLDMPELGDTRKGVIVGHSKGVVDTLEALVTYPELRPKISAVISLAGAIGGSPLADLAPDAAISLAQNTPGLQCKDGDGGAMESLRPSVRRAWLANNPLPADVAYYSIVGLPTPDRISRGLKAAYNVLSDIDPRNDGNLIFYDQVVPGSTLLGYANADHWAISTDMGTSPYSLVRSLADKSDYPREQLLEAALRFVELDMATRPRN